MMNAWKAWSPSLYRNTLILVGHCDPKLSQACSRQSCFGSCQSQFCGQIGQVKRNNVGSASASFVFPEPQTCPSDASDASDASVSMCQPWLHIAGGTVVRWYGWFRILASGGNMWERYGTISSFPGCVTTCDYYASTLWACQAWIEDYPTIASCEVRIWNSLTMRVSPTCDSSLWSSKWCTCTCV